MSKNDNIESLIGCVGCCIGTSIIILGFAVVLGIVVKLFLFILS